MLYHMRVLRRSCFLTYSVTYHDFNLRYEMTRERDSLNGMERERERGGRVVVRGEGEDVQ